MKRLLTAFAFAVVSLAVPALPALATSAAPAATPAPADKQFGRARLTIVQICTEIGELSAQAGARRADTAAVERDAERLENALHDWQAHYPQDPWIPKNAYALAEIYGKLNRADAHAHHERALDWLVVTYPSSDYAELPRD